MEIFNIKNKRLKNGKTKINSSKNDQIKLNFMETNLSTMSTFSADDECLNYLGSNSIWHAFLKKKTLLSSFVVVFLNTLIENKQSVHEKKKITKRKYKVKSAILGRTKDPKRINSINNIRNSYNVGVREDCCIESTQPFIAHDC